MMIMKLKFPNINRFRIWKGDILHKILLNEIKLEKLGILETKINAIKKQFIVWKNKSNI